VRPWFKCVQENDIDNRMLMYQHIVMSGRGLHSSTSQLKLRRVSCTRTPCTPYKPPNTPLTRATQSLRTPPIPYKALKLS